jgi:hypothetical protein
MLNLTPSEQHAAARCTPLTPGTHDHPCYRHDAPKIRYDNVRYADEAPYVTHAEWRRAQADAAHLDAMEAATATRAERTNPQRRI